MTTHFCVKNDFADYATWEEQQLSANGKAVGTPEKELAIAVIRNAFVDARNAEHHEELEEWLESSDFVNWCEYLDVAHARIAVELRHIIKQAQEMKIGKNFRFKKTRRLR